MSVVFISLAHPSAATGFLQNSRKYFCPPPAGRWMFWVYPPCYCAPARLPPGSRREPFETASQNGVIREDPFVGRHGKSVPRLQTAARLRALYREEVRHFVPLRAVPAVRAPARYVRAPARYVRVLPKYVRVVPMYARPSARYERIPPTYARHPARYEMVPLTYERHLATYQRMIPTYERQPGRQEKHPATVENGRPTGKKHAPASK